MSLELFAPVDAALSFRAGARQGMAELEQLKAALERIHDIAETVLETQELSPRAKQAFDEILAVARHKPDATTELPAEGEGPFALGGGSIMDGHDLLT
jgi:arginase family enzyme